MFKNKTNRSAEELPLNSTTVIGAGTVITGSIKSNGDIRIDGTIIGNLEANAKIFIGVSGIVEGDVDGKQADVLGKITGKISIADLLYIHGKADIDGDIYAGKLQIEPTASFNGQCHMGGNVVELFGENAKAVNE